MKTTLSITNLALVRLKLRPSKHGRLHGQFKQFRAGTIIAAHELHAERQCGKTMLLLHRIAPGPSDPPMNWFLRAVQWDQAKAMHCAG